MEALELLETLPSEYSHEELLRVMTPYLEKIRDNYRDWENWQFPVQHTNEVQN